MSKSFIRVLIVEDRASWQKSLKSMYESVLGDRGEVACCANPNDAIDRLERREYDLLSLDIALGDHKEVGADGLDVFDKAVQASPPLVSGVIVITGARFDKQLKRAIPDKGRRATVEIELQPYLERWYPGRVRMFEKHPGSSCKEVVDRVEKAFPSIVATLGVPPKAYVFDDKSKTVWCLHNRETYRVSHGTYDLLKELYAAQTEKGGPVANRELYDRIYPNKARVDNDMVLDYYKDRFRKTEEDARFKKDLVIKKRGFTSLHLSASE